MLKRFIKSFLAGIGFDPKKVQPGKLEASNPII